MYIESQSEDPYADMMLGIYKAHIEHGKYELMASILKEELEVFAKEQHE